MKKILSIIIVLFITNFAFSAEYSHFFVIDNQKVMLEEAKDKTQGLMYRDFLPANTGMVFIYTSYEDEAFWMKNMKFPLDIIFLKDGTVTRVYKNRKPCITDICKIYSSRGVVNQVIEVNAGFCKEHKIKKGTVIWVQENTFQNVR